MKGGIARQQIPFLSGLAEMKVSINIQVNYVV
jgi:hypothetical protein